MDGKIYSFSTEWSIVHDMDNAARRRAYACGCNIRNPTNSALIISGQHGYYKDDMVQRELNYAIVERLTHPD